VSRTSGYPKVVITNKVHPDTEAYLQTFCDPILNSDPEPLSREDLLSTCADAEGMMVFMNDHVDASFLEHCPHLRIISAALKGYDNFDLEAMSARNIQFKHIDDLLTVPTAELVLGLMITLARNVLAGDSQIRENAFNGWRPVLYGIGLEGETACILGMGKVGRTLATRLVACGMRVRYTDQTRLPKDREAHLGVEYCDFEEALETATFLIPLLPLVPATTHMIDKKALEKMPTGSFLINCCRGSVVKESDVADALESGQLGGYAADVFEMEDWALESRPRVIDPNLLRLKDRTVFTPHLGSAVKRVRREISLQAARNLELFF